MNRESININQEGNKYTYDLENEMKAGNYVSVSLKSLIATQGGQGKQTPYAERVYVICPCI